MLVGDNDRPQASGSTCAMLIVDLYAASGKVTHASASTEYPENIKQAHGALYIRRHLAVCCVVGT